MRSNEEIVREFITAWSRLNVEELGGLPPPGRSSTSSAAGDLVVAERVDRTRLGDKQVELPGCGVFEMSDGKIRIWRDYFDLATYTRAVG